MTDAEVSAAVEEAHRVGKRVAAHARSNESIKQCLRLGVDIIYHASYLDDEAADMFEQRKDDVFVAPGLLADRHARSRCLRLSARRPSRWQGGARRSPHAR